jgi:hypothetical protein
MSDSSDESLDSVPEDCANRISRASERERIYLDPSNPAESYIVLYTEEYLADDNVWNRRCYPHHVPEQEVSEDEGDARTEEVAGQQTAGRQ